MDTGMKKGKWNFIRVIMPIFLFLVMGVSFVKAEDSFSLTEEEEAYIAEQNVIKAIAVDGAAPIMYEDEKGQVQGIGRLVLDEISSMTGLIFEYQMRGSMEEAFAGDYDVFLAIPDVYKPDDMILSAPFLKSETILYLNSSVHSDQLEDKIFAAVKGDELPEGIKEENVKYYGIRKDSLDAVNRGEADFGYGNSYSVAFYIQQKGYKNLITVPMKKEPRAYCVGVAEKDEILLSIINKSIHAISEEHMQKLILDATIYADRKVNFSMVVDSYGRQLFAAASAVIAALTLSMVSYIRINRKLRVLNEQLKVQNVRHERLSHLSNEYLYEYFLDSGHLELSEKCIELFETAGEAEASVSEMKKMLMQIHNYEQTALITLPLADDGKRVFKAVNACVYDDKGNLASIIGKLIDISSEMAEKERLLHKSRTDGLTGLYNAAATKALVATAIAERKGESTDAFLLLDCDNFKKINDTYGHLVGDRILENLAESLRTVFERADILGRVGGDEFAVYIKDIPTADFVKQKCHQLKEKIQSSAGDIPASVCIGVAFVEEGTTYEAVFQKADDALYQAKRNGKAQMLVG